MKMKSIEKKEHSAFELVVEVGAEEFDQAINKVYQRQKHRIMIPGFRKGKAPRKMIEKMYGAEVFYEDAVEDTYPRAYEDALKESGLEPVAYPKLEVLSMGKEGFTFKALVTVRPEASVKDYKGLDVVRPEVKVSAADVKAELKPYIDRASRLVTVERKAKKGDVAVIDFEGFREGVPFEGGKGENYSLELGSHSFVPGFEEQVIGMKAGDEKDLDITFPEDYTPELAGAAVVFKVKVHEVKERQEPEIDDEFAKDVSEFNTLEEFKKDLGEKLKERRQTRADREFEDAVIDALIGKLECEVPEAMVDYRAEKIMDDYAARLQDQGIPFDQYVKMMGLTIDDMKAQAKTTADRAVRSELALEAVAEAEKLEVTEEEMDAEVARLAKEHDMSEERLRDIMDEKGVKKDLLARKALDLVKSLVKKPAAKKSAPKKAEPSAETEDQKKTPAKKPAAKKPAAKKPEAPAAEAESKKKPAARKTAAKKAEKTEE